MRLAFLTSLIPVARPDTGFEIANAAILSALREAGHDVVAIGFLRPGEIPADPAQAIVVAETDIENAVAPTARKLRWLSAAVRFGLPVASAKLRLAGAGRFVEAIRAHGPFDALVLNSVMLPGAFPELLGIAPCILVEHNIEHVSARQNAGHAGNPLLRRLYGREARLLERLERRLWGEARFIWTLAEEDRQALGLAYREKSCVLPLVSSDPVGTQSDDRCEPPIFDIGLIGTWTWGPNLIGLEWFLREIGPLLPADIRIAVAGRMPPELQASPNVRLVGRVPSAEGFLRSCRLVALSSRAGTGVQLKTIEAMQLGLPAVATTLSCRGFTELPANFTLADTAGDFARALMERVAAIRTGDRQRVDGAAFMKGQRAALANGLAQGLAAALG
ncbi:MAG: glycosyltransferase family 4 protein [Bosea sp.]|uniref:glycosyltransferase n=1 Tax=Bosea sp. (in: a-proteobacteria) TaxID=1871050 RepID=UPI001AC2A2B3|nr:glycosyltransferase [Bosea sp. (in: a-proteobacteria)]MBN9453485.1 glycosyltransferase family 4 protein [Bosea sp. (in: a-proteobacteria)]